MSILYFLLGGIFGILIYFYCKHTNNLDYLFTTIKCFDKILFYSNFIILFKNKIYLKVYQILQNNLKKKFNFFYKKVNAYL